MAEGDWVGAFAAIAPATASEAALVDVRGRAVHWRSSGSEAWSTRVDVGFATSLIRVPGLGSVVTGTAREPGRGSIVTTAAVGDDGELLWRVTVPARSARARALLVRSAPDPISLVLTDDGRVLRLDHQGVLTPRLGPSALRPNAVAVEAADDGGLAGTDRYPLGTILLGDATTDAIVRLDPRERRGRVHARLPRGSWPRSLAIDGRGDLYAACAGSCEVAVIDSNGRVRLVRMPQMAGQAASAAPVRVIPAEDGVHVVAGDRLWYLHPDTGAVSEVATLDAPVDVVSDEHGGVVALEFSGAVRSVVSPP